MGYMDMDILYIFLSIKYIFVNYHIFNNHFIFIYSVSAIICLFVLNELFIFLLFCCQCTVICVCNLIIILIFVLLQV
eukprot:UN11143